MSYVILRGCWCDIIILNIHAPTEDKVDYMKDIFYKELERVFDKFPKYHMKMLLHFSANLRRVDIFKARVGNESLHEINKGDGGRVVNFATSKYLIVKSTILPHHNIHKFIWTSAGKTHSHIHHILIVGRRRSNVLDVQLFRGADCDTDCYLVVAKVRERLAVRKQTTHSVHMENDHSQEIKRHGS
jgi:hypothetical protein